MWVVTPPQLFLYSDTLPPSLSLIHLMAHATSSQTFSRTIILVHSIHIYLPMKMEQTECSETSKSRRRVITQKKAYNIQNKATAWNQEFSSSLHEFVRSVVSL